MDFDAFTGGIAPGGLRSKSDIRILICYILKSVQAPLSGELTSMRSLSTSMSHVLELATAVPLTHSIRSLPFIFMAVQFIQFNQSLSLCGHLLIGHHDVLRLLPWEGHQVGGVVDAGFLQVHKPVVHQHEGLPPTAFPGTSLALSVAVGNGPYLP